MTRRAVVVRWIQVFHFHLLLLYFRSDRKGLQRVISSLLFFAVPVNGQNSSRASITHAIYSYKPDRSYATLLRCLLEAGLHAYILPQAVTASWFAQVTCSWRHWPPAPL